MSEDLEEVGRAKGGRDAIGWGAPDWKQSMKGAEPTCFVSVSVFVGWRPKSSVQRMPGTDGSLQRNSRCQLWMVNTDMMRCSEWDVSSTNKAS